ncbi:MAG: aminoglycoside phosphotransferase family protein [Parvularcula sp.]
MTDPRDLARKDVLEQAGWSLSAVAALPADASTRQYFRLSDGQKTALLMDAPPAAEGAICPPDASAEQRRALGYNAAARLAGGRIDAFVEIARWLSACGVRAPKIFSADMSCGFAVLEDFGDVHLRDIASTDEEGLYRRALKVLDTVRRHPVTHGKIGTWCLQTYDSVALSAEADLFLEWYLPNYAGDISADAAADWQKAWSGLLQCLSPPTTLVLRDFHAENILVPDEGALAVIDFQDALVGQAAYDVASLLEDARRDVDLLLAQELLEDYARSTDDKDAFLRDYAILALQRNMKILGVFARLIHRDRKEKYGAFFARVRGHVARDLNRPEVAPIRAWVEQNASALLQDEAKT